MSHICRLDVAFKDIQVLKQACRELKVDFEEGPSRFRRHGGSTQCDHVIKVPGADYDVGVCQKKRKAGETGPVEYELRLDTWGPGGKITKVLGKDCNRLKQRYSVGVIKKEMARKGYAAREKQMAECVVRVVLSK